jgi:hypothetical protein
MHVFHAVFFATINVDSIFYKIGGLILQWFRMTHYLHYRMRYLQIS